MPKEVNLIINKLTEAGYEAFAVGGCVRDSILGKEPNDWDITTSATPYEIKEVFNRTIDTGIKHGTVTVLIGKSGYEVTTYRIDGEYEDNRHPKEVEFTTNLVEDLKRRDFTINAMAYNSQIGLVDEFDGIKDIEAGIIRCVGKAEDRFDEDALRIMRAIRFSAQLGYEIEKETKDAIGKMCSNLKNISAERINTELTKLIISPNPGFLRTAYELGILDIILPELSGVMEVEQNNPHHCYTVGEHILHTVENIESDRVLRYAMLFHDLGKGVTRTTSEDGIDHFHGHQIVSRDMADSIMKRLKFDNDTISKVKKLVEYHDIDIESSERPVRRAINKLGKDIFPLLMKVKRADVLAQSDYKRVEKLSEIEKLSSLYEEILLREEATELKDLAISGKELIQMGIKPGPQIGEVLNILLNQVIDDPSKNNLEYLLNEAKGMI